jgi:hypothetical protein
VVGAASNRRVIVLVARLGTLILFETRFQARDIMNILQFVEYDYVWKSLFCLEPLIPWRRSIDHTNGYRC